MLLKLNAESNNFLVSIGATGRSKTKCVTLALARAVAYILDMPPGPVEDPHAYYRTEHSMAASGLVGSILEVCLLDTAAVLKEVESFYMFRYQNLYDTGFFHSTGVKGNGIQEVFKLYNHFSEDTLCHIKDNANEISIMNMQFVKIVKELNKVV
jgi:hypothetical protein